MRRIYSSAMLAGFLAFTACAGGDDAAEQPADTAAQPVETGAPAGQPAPTGNIVLPEGVTPEMVAEGQQVFNGTICFSCHGMNGTGGPLAPALNDQVWINIADGSYEQIVGVIKTGVMTPQQFPAPMPALGGAPLTDEQVNAVAAYVYSISHGG